MHVWESRVGLLKKGTFLIVYMYTVHCIMTCQCLLPSICPTDQKNPSLINVTFQIEIHEGGNIYRTMLGFIHVPHTCTLYQGSEKSAVQASETSRFSFWASNFSLLLAQWARYQASRLPTESLKEQTKTCPGQAKFKGYLSQGPAGMQVFFLTLCVLSNKQEVLVTKIHLSYYCCIM